MRNTVAVAILAVLAVSACARSARTLTSDDLRGLGSSDQLRGRVAEVETNSGTVQGMIVHIDPGNEILLLVTTPSAFDWSDSTSIAFDEVRSVTVVEDSGALTSLVLAGLVVVGAVVVATGSALGSVP